MSAWQDLILTSFRNQAHPVNPSMETGRDIADRFNMQKWFLDASITELDNLDRTINALHH